MLLTKTSTPLLFLPSPPPSGCAFCLPPVDAASHLCKNKRRKPQLRYSTAMVAANLVNVTTAQQILKSGEEVESRLSQLSGLIVPLLGGSSG